MNSNSWRCALVLALWLLFGPGVALTAAASLPAATTAAATTATNSPASSWTLDVFERTREPTSPANAATTSRDPSSGFAAEAGPRALPVGPWGQKVVDARDRLPSSWGPGNPNAKGAGTRWSDPSAPQTNGLRLDQGIPGSGWPSQQVDHVVVRSGGRILGPDGKPIVGSLRENPQAHIPLSDWRNWSSWNAP